MRGRRLTAFLEYFRTSGLSGRTFFWEALTSFSGFPACFSCLCRCRVLQLTYQPHHRRPVRPNKLKATFFTSSKTPGRNSFPPHLLGSSSLARNLVRSESCGRSFPTALFVHPPFIPIHRIQRGPDTPDGTKHPHGTGRKEGATLPAKPSLGFTLYPL